MFAKAAIKRFNDAVSETPAPVDYNPKEAASKGTGVAPVKSDRFVEPKTVTPGPGQYDVLIKRPPRKSTVVNSVKKASSKTSSRASSTSSLNVDHDEEVCFKTPIKKMVDDGARLEAKINELTCELEQLKDCLQLKADKLTEFQDKEEELKELKIQLGLSNEEKGRLEMQLNQANEELELEKKDVEEKSTFLHFTQEQLNTELESLRDQVASLQREVSALKAALKSAEKALEFETQKLEEVTETYVRENNETEAEFNTLKEEALNYKGQLESTNHDMDFYKTHNEELSGQVDKVQYQLDSVFKEKTKLEEKVEMLEQDVDVHLNDKGVLEAEMQRIEAEKNELALDLAAITSDKEKLDDNLGVLSKEKEYLLNQVKELLDEKEDVEDRLSGSTDKHKAQLSDLYTMNQELQAITGKQKALLDSKDKVCNELRCEVEELEMKNSSLEGALCSSQSEVCNLASENKALLGSFESVEESLRSYIHRCQDLNVEIDELESAKADLNDTCIILEERMNRAEEHMRDNKDQMDELFIEIANKDGDILKLKGAIQELENKVLDLQELVGLLEQRNTTCNEIHEEKVKQFQEELQAKNEEGKQMLDEMEDFKAELGNVREERAQLVAMSEDMSNQISDGLATIKKLQDREQELSQRLESARRDLEVAHSGMTAELHNHWEAEDEIMNLQSDLDQTRALLENANEQIRMLTSKLNETSMSKVKFQKVEEDYEQRISTCQNERDEAVEQLALLKQELEEQRAINSELKSTEQLVGDLKDKLRLVETYEVELRGEVESKEGEITSLTISLEAQQKLIVEKEREAELLNEELEQADKLESKYGEMEAILQEYMDDTKELKEREAQLLKSNKDKDNLITSLKQELDPLAENASCYKEKYDALLAMVEPFKDQLESYEMERNMLMSRNQEAQGEVKKLATQYAQLLGHQNHKQKIHHLIKIKKENVEMREEIAKLKLELNKEKRALSRLQSKVTTTGNKENKSLMQTPGPKTPFDTTPFRRQTIASPLSRRNLK